MIDDLDLSFEDDYDRGRHRRRRGGGKAVQKRPRRRGRSFFALLLVLILLGGLAGGGYYGFTKVRGYFAVQDYPGAGTGEVNVEVKADPKSFDLLDLHGPVIVEGKIRLPRIHIGRAIPIPTPVFGNAKDVACPALTQQLFLAQ